MLFFWRKFPFSILKMIFSLIRENKIVFGLGFCIGVSFAVLVHFVKDPEHVLSHFHLVGMAPATYGHLSIQKTLSYFEANYDFAYEKWLSANFNGAQSVQLDPDKRRYSANETIISKEFINILAKNVPENISKTIESYVNEKEVLDPRTEAFFLYNKIPVICIVYPTELDWARAVKDTWGRHCNELNFFSHKIENSSLGIELIKASSEFSLICQSFQKVYFENKDDQSPWILISTQDTFVLVENFRFYVAPFNRSGEYYLGHAMKFWNAVYNWADAGYAISWPTLKRFVGEKFTDVAACEAGGQNWRNGDWHLGRQLRELGILPIDTRDHAGRGRFNGYSLKKLLFPGGVSLFERYWRDSLYLSSDGPHCCSNYAVTFHGILSKSKMYQLEYLYYHLIPFHGGGVYGNAPAPSSRRDSKAPSLTWEEHLKEEALAKMFGPVLMTTPKDMEKIMAMASGL